jgi:hypothetical protein
MVSSQWVAGYKFSRSQCLHDCPSRILTSTLWLPVKLNKRLHLLLAFTYATAADLFNDSTSDHQASQAAFGDWLRKRDLPAYQQSGRGAVDRVAQEAESSSEHDQSSDSWLTQNNSLSPFFNPGLTISGLGLGCVKTLRRLRAIEEVIRLRLFQPSNAQTHSTLKANRRMQFSRRFDLSRFSHSQGQTRQNSK